MDFETLREYYGRTYRDEYVTWVNGTEVRHKRPPTVEAQHTSKLKAERSMLKRMILEEKGKSGLESTKAVDRLIAAIQTEGFTVD